MRKNIEIINWDLLSKNLTGDASEQERAELKKWLALDEKNRMLFKAFKKLGQNKNVFESVQELDVEQALRNIKASNAKARIFTFRKLAQIAAVFIIVLGLSFLLRYDFLSPEITVKTKEGERKEVVLADMSKISLNENSVFVYPKKFKGRERNVKLVGEAYFIVNQDETKPFIVEADEAYVKVLGTEFNIVNRHYSEDISVLVTKGSVQFGSNKANKESIVLKNGDAGTYNKVKQTLDYENNPDFNNIAWKTKYLEFKNETLEKVALRLEEVFFIEFEIDEGLKSRKISATYDDQPIEMIIQILEATLNVKIIELSKNNYKIDS